MSCGKKTTHTKSIGCCPLCKELFWGDSAFQKHRGHGPACTPPEDVGLVAHPSPSAPEEIVWRGPPRPGNSWPTKEAS